MFTKWFLFLNSSVETVREYVKSLAGGAFLLKKNVLIVVMGISLIAPMIVGVYFCFFMRQDRILNEKMIGLEKKVKSLVELKNQQDRFVREFGASDIGFLQNYIEPMQLLKEEVELLTKIGKQTSYEPVQKRLAFLTGEENQIKFVQEAVRKSNYYSEIEWKLDHPVEVGVKDLRQIISLIEGAKSHPLRPQLIIKKFSFHSNHLDLEVIQRNSHAKN